MKKYFLFIFVSTLLLGCPQSLRAQTARCLKVTTSNIPVRTRPNAKAPITHGTGQSYKWESRTDKGWVVKNLGKRRNGYIYVEGTIGGSQGWHGGGFERGWIPAKYLRNATKCSICKGKGFFNRKCPDCDGEGFWGCCYETGKLRCNSCKGVGYK